MYCDLFQLMINKSLSEFARGGELNRGGMTGFGRFSQLLTPCLILVVILSSSYISLSALYYISTLKAEGICV